MFPVRKRTARRLISQLAWFLFMNVRTLNEYTSALIREQFS